MVVGVFSGIVLLVCVIFSRVSVCGGFIMVVSFLRMLVIVGSVVLLVISSIWLMLVGGFYF